MSAELQEGADLPRLGIDREGEWFTEEGEITHAGIVATLRQQLREEEGRYFVQIGPQRFPVEVEDTPFTVVRVEPQRGEMSLLLNDGSSELLNPFTLKLAEGDVPYCKVKGGRFEARLTRAAAHQLARSIEYDEASNRAVLVLGGARYVLASRSGSRGAPAQ